MSSFPRRSARLSPNLTQDQLQSRLSSSSVPSLHQISQPSSTSTTSHPSPSNPSLNPPPPPPTPHQSNGLKVQPTFMSHPSHLNVPLPSPSANDMSSFLGRPQSQPNPYTTQQSSYSHSAPEQTYQQQTSEQAPQLHPHTNSISQSHPQNIRDLNPSQLPPDFLAEAAKRAQIACLMRDLGDVTL